MKWKSHIGIGVSYGYATMNGELNTLIALGIGSIIPDVIDRFVSMGNENLWKSVHRKASHWWVLYISVILLSVYTGWYYLYFFGIGGLLHIYADSLTVSGVPFINPLRAGYGFKKAVTGKITEYAYAIGILLAVMALGRLNGYLPVWTVLTIVFIASAYLNKSEKKTDNADILEVTLAELSVIWTGGVRNTSELADSKQEITSPAPETRFSEDELNKFYQTYVVSLPSQSVTVIKELLNILDKKGDCPSVVNRTTDINPYTEPSTYTALSKIPLWRHSLNVAEEILKPERNIGAYASQLIIAALAHDIGKSDALDRAMYSMGDHPRISVLILEGIPGFNELPFKNDVESAVLGHHRTGGGVLADKLRDADRLARRKELAEVLPTLDAGDVFDVPKKHSSPVVAPSQGGIFDLPAETEKEKKPTESHDIAWLDIDSFLGEIAPRINKVSGNRFDAFSMPDGVVYFQTDLFWKVLKKLARDGKHNEVLLADGDQKLRRNYLYTVTEMLRERRFIADGLIKNGFFSAPFIVTFRDGTSFNKAYYTPLVSEAFGDVSELESLKTGIVKEIVSVNPKYQEETE